MTLFDQKHHKIQSIVNKVIYNAPKEKFTMNDLVNALKKQLPKDFSNGDFFYAVELLKGTVCRLVLSDSIKKIDNTYYAMNDD